MINRSTLFVACLCTTSALHAQHATNTTRQANTENIYEAKQAYLEHVLHSPVDKTKEPGDNDLSRFNRWFNFAEPRCYPTGDMPRPDVLLKAYEKTQAARKTAYKTTAAPVWALLGPQRAPTGFFGVGRANCITIDPVDTNKIYVGTACGGVWKSTNSGAGWASSSDNFPSLSVADIAINPINRNIIYAATGDGYGYEAPSTGPYNMFWGGLYSAGVMKSTDGGNTWAATGLSYLQTNKNIIQRLLIHPLHPDTLLAATRTGTYRTTNGGTTWSLVDAGHVFSLAFKPGSPDVVYAINNTSFKVSYDAGLTWVTLMAGIGSGSRCTIAVSGGAPDNVWVLNDDEDLYLSVNAGVSFSMIASLATTFTYYGYYDRVLVASPTDPNTLYTAGLDMGVSHDGGFTWSPFDPSNLVHPDNHAFAVNPLNPNVVYNANDGGVFVTRNDGLDWKFLDSGLAISQIYRISASRQQPKVMLAGLQDNGSFYNDGTNWLFANVPLGDGMDNAICPLTDSIQIASTQYGNFYISEDKGENFYPASSTAFGSWVSPVVFHPRSRDTVYYGLDDVYMSFDRGYTMYNLGAPPFTGGAIALAIAHSNTQVLYAADRSKIYRTTNGGATWVNVTSGLPASSYAITGIAVDFNDPMHVFVSLSGYSATSRVYTTTNGGSGWANFSTGLPSIPVNCIAVDSSTPGAVFAGTDLGVYYRDSSSTSWAPYGTALPNVIVDDIDINYKNYKIRVATYGRGVWEANLVKAAPIVNSVGEVANSINAELYPNPTHTAWSLTVSSQVKEYTVRLSDISGRVLMEQANIKTIDASKLATGTYTIEIIAGEKHHTLKAIRN
jgi:photosystem II stability/assembly factor-like uncharacterized protein